MAKKQAKDKGTIRLLERIMIYCSCVFACLIIIVNPHMVKPSLATDVLMTISGDLAVLALGLIYLEESGVAEILMCLRGAKK